MSNTYRTSYTNKYYYHNSRIGPSSLQNDQIPNLVPYTQRETAIFPMEILYSYLNTFISTVQKRRKKENETYVHIIYIIYILQKTEGKDGKEEVLG